MEKYKYQFAALLVALIIGFALGGMYTGKNKNKELLKQQEKYEKELERLNKESVKEIKIRDVRIRIFEEAARKDSTLIRKLEKEIAADGVKVAEKVKYYKSLTNEQKKKYLTDRYLNPPN